MGIKTEKAWNGLIIFLFGGVIYSLIEILFRGYTHWSMTITGGVCLMILYKHFRDNPEESMAERCLFGTIIITTAEFTVGCIVNLWLKWDIWDYSAHRLNLLGQICPLFSAMWFLITIPVTGFCNFLQRKLEPQTVQAVRGRTKPVPSGVRSRFG